MIETKDQIKVGFKKTKLGWIPEDWEETKLFQSTSYVDYRGKTPKKTEEGVFLVTAKNIKNGFIDYNASSEYISNQDFENVMSRGKVEIGDVLITTEAPLGNIAQIDKNGIALAQRVIKYRGNKNDINNSYLKYFLQSYAFQKELILESTGSTVKGIKGSRLHKMPCLYPKLPEQKAIATCLSTWDTAITKLNTLITAKQQLKKALMQQLLIGKKRLPGFDGVWEEKRLDYFFDERSERNNSDDLELLSIGAAGVYPQDNSNKKDTSNSNKSKYKKICVGDIGYNTMRMWQGRSALSSLNGIVSPAYTIVKPKKETDSKFFAYLFKDPAIIHRFYRNSQGMVNDTLNCKFKDFAIVKLKLPTEKKEQTAIAQVLNTADQEIQLLTTQRDQLQLQKKGLMQVLLTGKKRLEI